MDKFAYLDAQKARQAMLGTENENNDSIIQQKINVN